MLAASSSSSRAAAPGVFRETVDGIEIVRLTDPGSGIEVRVAPGLGNNSYEMTAGGKQVFWSPYKSLKEFAAKPSHLGNPLLWPWANRIDGTSYWVNGKKYTLNLELGNVRPGPNNTPIHGLLIYTNRWKVLRAAAARDGAAVTSRIEFHRYPDWMAQFPFAHNVEMTYSLRGGALEVLTRIENISAEPMPVCLGYHPYFQITDAPRAAWKVKLAAREKLVLSQRLIPTGERMPVTETGPFALEDKVVDNVYVSLDRDADGFARFWVAGEKQKITVEYGPKYSTAVVYAPKGRDLICFEPMSGITNAFNAAQAGWYRDLQSIPAGEAWQEVFRVRPEGF
jgi:aldose 1-epimerase